MCEVEFYRSLGEGVDISMSEMRAVLIDSESRDDARA